MHRITILFTLLFSLFTAGIACAQQKHTPFNGLLLDLQGNPIKNAHIYLRDHRAYALSTKDGKFGLTDVKAADTLHILIKKRLYTVPVNGKKSVIIRLADEKNIQTEEDKRLVDIGYGYVTRREHTNATEAFISGEDLVRTGQSNILAALAGRAPGMDIYYEQGEWKAKIRGTRTLYGSTDPLYVVDGVITPSLDAFSIPDIDYIEIMKDGSIYGSQGANGAIIVHLKR